MPCRGVNDTPHLPLLLARWFDDRLHESVGFRRAGVYREVGWKQGRWHDVGIWQASLAEPNGTPDEPKRFADTGVRRDP